MYMGAFENDSVFMGGTSFDVWEQENRLTLSGRQVKTHSNIEHVRRKDGLGLQAKWKCRMRVKCHKSMPCTEWMYTEV